MGDVRIDELFGMRCRRGPGFLNRLERSNACGTFEGIKETTVRPAYERQTPRNCPFSNALAVTKMR
jgi:hypothetical protein